jgi:hypothetical protein
MNNPASSYDVVFWSSVIITNIYFAAEKPISAAIWFCVTISLFVVKNYKK